MTIAQDFLDFIKSNNIPVQNAIAEAVFHSEFIGTEIEKGKSCTYIFSDDSKIRINYHFWEVIE